MNSYKIASISHVTRGLMDHVIRWAFVKEDLGLSHYERCRKLRLRYNLLISLGNVLADKIFQF
jgi:hypothetical protein